MRDIEDPDDMCVHCHAMIVGYYFRKCPFCGRIWWKLEKVTPYTVNNTRRI